VSHLLDVGARVVFTADRLPRDIEGLDPRLRSKISSGLVAELDAPDAEVRREILRRKAAHGGVKLPDACRELIVDSVRGNVRDLEGVLIQLVATASLLKRPIDPELTLVALRKLAPVAPGRRRLAVREVIEAVAAYFQKRPDELALRSRRRDVLVPRQLAMYLCRRYTDVALGEIGHALGRDHSAVANAVRVVERRILERAPLRYQVEALAAKLDAMLGEA
jgi:chromosomal replication initiator protein